MGCAAVMGEFDNAALAVRLREEIARQNLSRARLADAARLSLSTLEKGLTGRRRFTLETIVRLEQALGASLREAAPAPAPASAPAHTPVPLSAPEPAPAAPAPMLAPPEMGSYARPAVQWIEGEYLTLRASFGEDRSVYAYRTDIGWDAAKGHLVFAESDRVDTAFQQAGFVSMPHLSGHIYLMTSEAGQYRMIMLGRATHERRMFGLISTLQVGRGSQLVPVSCPVALVPVDQVAQPVFGLVRDGDEAWDEYRAVLDTALSSDFCRLRR
ncbi:MAG: helix-turn-helix transcriptional regulator [Erythrobacter sp.]|nr:helix-turn-helix transcriptional regulator [Erythrobacter sp.]